ncbi:MAG: hypothetical protein OXF11_21125 [Deltaproteobacteria bacterium]|nr:hypothetical protein [Deltaproteobacteria bacterium]
MEENYQLLPIDKISFDTENPRIRMALQKYGHQLNAERIHFALRSATDGDRGASSYTHLRDSILAKPGITVPVTVTMTGGDFVCIDGNTRLAIYKQLQKEGVDGPWATIKAIVLENADQRDVETVRVSAHLVGAREWPAYEKARYLHYLRNQKFMDYSEMIALCGGNKVDIERQMYAYQDMNEYYRDVVDDTAFHIDRFSGFVELQKRGVKEAIYAANLDLKDFGEWIRDGKIYRLADVRSLPKVLRNDEAREIFLSGGPRSIEAAMAAIDRQSEQADKGATGATTLDAASVFQLAEVLTRRINDMPYSEVRALRNKEREEAEDQVRCLEDLAERVRALIEDVSE